MKKLKYRAALLGTRGDRGPDPLAPAPAGESSCAMSDLAINDDESQGLLGEVICRLDAWRGDELEVSLAMIAKSSGDIQGFRSLRWTLRNLQNPIPGLLQLNLELLRRHALSPVDDAEERTDLRQESIGKVLGNLVAQLLQELDVPDQVGKAELHQHMEIAHVFAIGGEIVAAEDPLEFLSQDLDQDIGSSRLVDAEESVQMGSEAPCPVLLPVLLVTRLVNVQPGLQRECGLKLSVGILQGDADLVDELAQVAAGELDLDDVPEELSDRRERRVAGSLHVGHQGGQPRSGKPRRHHFQWEGSEHNLPTLRAPLRVASVLMDVDQLLTQFRVLTDPGRLLRRTKLGAAVRAALKRVVVHVINLFGGERGTLVTWMSRLSAALELSPPEVLLSRRFDDVARRWLRGGRRVLQRFRQLKFELFDSGFELGVLGSEAGVFCREFSGLGALPDRLPSLILGRWSAHI